MYHGTHNSILGTSAAHIGLCLTDSIDIAGNYAGSRGKVFAVAIDMSDLDLVEVDGYDHNSDIAPGDSGAEFGCDVITFDDEDERGNWHRTWRLVSQRAVDACELTLVRYMDSDQCPCAGGCDLCCW
jgi:hypothetical protein